MAHSGGGGWQGGGWQGQPQQQHHHAAPAGDALARFRDSGVYHQKAALNVILADMVQLRDYDTQIEARVRTHGRSSCLLWVLTVAAGAAAVVIWPLAILAVLLLIAAVVFSVKWGRASKLDLENRRYELVAQLLELVGRDSDWSQPLHVYLDLRPADHGSKLQSTHEQSPWTIQTFIDPFMSLEGTLGDGTRYKLGATERRRIRSGWKRGSSGKLKHKTKTKSKYRFEVDLIVRTKKHPRLEIIAASGHGAVQLPPFVQPKKLKCKKGVLHLEVSLPSEWDETAGDTQVAAMTTRASPIFAAMLLSTYQIVTLSKQVAKQATRGSS